MTIPTPEPVAFAAGGHPNHLCSRAQYNSMLGKNRIKFDVPLITTAQAEAYADARVRQALEAAIAICDAAYEQGKSEYRTSCNPYFEGGCDAAESIESKIRALIPPLPGPVEPTT